MGSKWIFREKMKNKYSKMFTKLLSMKMNMECNVKNCTKVKAQ